MIDREDFEVIHVDAKIVNRDKNSGYRTFVAFSSENGSNSRVEEIHTDDSHQADAAELYAIEFAMRTLENKGKHFILLCDNESVVKQLQKADLKFTMRTRPVFRRVWESLHGKDSKFEIRHFPMNRADRILNEQWNRSKS